MTADRKLHAVLPLFLLVTLVWGTNWSLFPLAVQELSVWTFRAVSTLAAALLLFAWARARGESLALPRGHRLSTLTASWAYLLVWNIARLSVRCASRGWAAAPLR